MKRPPLTTRVEDAGELDPVAFARWLEQYAEAVLVIEGLRPATPPRRRENAA